MQKFANQICYGELIPQQTTMNFQYIVAALEAMQCYSPITTETEDGVDNCLTELNLDNFFNNVTDITGLCFLPKGSTYRPAALPDPEIVAPLELGGGDWTTNDGELLGDIHPNPYDSEDYSTNP